MGSRLVNELLLRLRQRQRQPMVMPLTAKFVLEACMSRSFTERAELLDMAGEAVEYGAAVFIEYDEDGDGWMRDSDLQAALETCGFTVRGEYLTRLRVTYSHLGCISYDGFLKACARVAKRRW